MYRFRLANQIDPRFIEAYLQTTWAANAIDKMKTGGSDSGLNLTHARFRLLPIRVAPTNEQLRIVDAIEEIFSDIEASVCALERVRGKLKFYRASILKAAVEGMLTAEWRAQHSENEPASELLKRILVDRRRCWEQEQIRKFEEQGKKLPKNWEAKYREPVSPDTSHLPLLPKGWVWASLDQLGKLDRGRSKHRPRNAELLYGGPYPFIQTGDVRKARQYLREHSQTYSEAGLRQSRLWPAETLCITIAANIAETAILSYAACFPDSIVGVCFQPSLVSVRYAELFIRSAKARISTYAPATAQKNINNDILRALAVPLPPFQEQEEIVNAVEAQLSLIDHLDDELDIKMHRVDSLRRAILHQAFSGKLVPLDPNDEPASELLKRIICERERHLSAARVRREMAKSKAPPNKRTREVSRSGAKHDQKSDDAIGFCSA